jgi:hypothetical protein
LPCADRETTIGGMINSYLTRAADLDDHAVHLLFAANRWEKKCVRSLIRCYTRARALGSPYP